MQERRWKPQSNDVSPRPLYLDPDNVKERKLIQKEERAARRRAWIMANKLGFRLGSSNDMGDNFFFYQRIHQIPKPYMPLIDRSSSTVALRTTSSATQS